MKVRLPKGLQTATAWSGSTGGQQALWGRRRLANVGLTEIDGMLNHHFREGTSAKVV